MEGCSLRNIECAAHFQVMVYFRIAMDAQILHHVRIVHGDLAGGDGIARDIRIRRSTFAISHRTCLGERGPFAMHRGHGGVTCGVGDLAIFDLAIRCTHGIGDAGRSRYPLHRF